MTEVTDEREALGTYAVDPVAFVGAILGVLAPFAVPAALILGLAALGEPERFAPGFFFLAAVLSGIAITGGAVLATIGAPIAYLRLRRGHTGPWGMALIAVYADLALLVLSVPAAILIGDDDAFSLIFLFLIGVPFAALWGWLFARLYTLFRRDFYARPL